MTIIPTPDWDAIADEILAPGLFNIRTNDGRLMLSVDTDKAEALYWLDYYQTRYAAGRPMPSGKGYYRELGFHLVELLDDGSYAEPAPDLCAA
ncbi:hypothetical protein [Bradyrhizobium sp. SZCCHNRI2010]|uniref:hypothetical protein n=1 Tax=Bradyrhizobium sp. SZCCHNRI2010 TaxID=3057283 RepID=UPI0028ED6032|nr:hypothetical protein [Bradyrhizobium sp. SZCCHNRI2010]